MEKTSQSKKLNLLREFRLSRFIVREPSIEQIGQQLTHELTDETEIQSTFNRSKSVKDKRETNSGRILIICDSNIPEYLIPWLTAKRYRYTVVNDDDENIAYLEREHFDCVAYSHEFY